MARAEYKYNRERDAIRVEHARKKEDKQARREEIKKKYGAVGAMGAVCVECGVRYDQLMRECCPITEYQRSEVGASQLAEACRIHSSLVSA